MCIKVQDGDSVKDVPVVPIKDGYTGKWDHDGTNITVDTTINAVYQRIFKFEDDFITCSSICNCPDYSNNDYL